MIQSSYSANLYPPLPQFGKLKIKKPKISKGKCIQGAVSGAAAAAAFNGSALKAIIGFASGFLAGYHLSDPLYNLFKNKNS